MAILTLLSDFGSTSPYPAAMKAIVASLCDATLIDISHDVPRHDIRWGAYLLAALTPHTPAGTVHLAVVDPGVGTDRKPLIVVSGGQFFVGPDNGLLLPAAKRVGQARVFEVTATSTLGPRISATFHGRDIFAPIAGQLVLGTPVSALAAPLKDYVDLDFGTGRREEGAVIGSIIHIDPFGNLVTNIPPEYLGDLNGVVTIRVGQRTVSGKVCRTYGDVDRGAAGILVGSDGFVEVVVREGSAAALLDSSPGTMIHMTARKSRQGV